MRLNEARIGYAGYSRDFNAPGDRRRFAAYARIKGVPIEYARLDREYDLVLVTHNGDIPGWTARKRRDGSRLKFVFELADSYFTQTEIIRRFLKGPARYALGIDSRLSPDFMMTLIRACEAADAVICSTEEQALAIGRYNPNVFTSFDFFGEDIDAPKSDYHRGDKLRLVWEGQSTTLANIRTIREVLNDLRDRIELHVVTDPVIYRYFGRFGAHPARDALRGIECETIFHSWRLDRFSEDISAADLAIIPIDTSDVFARGKPENKLVMMWQLGMPALASATPAYERAMRAAGLDLLCADASDWQARLEQMVTAPPSELQSVGHKGRELAERAYSRGEFMRRFDSVFEAIGLDVG
jgi:glycosyltransferase involved in cell wall biosynthesis